MDAMRAMLDELMGKERNVPLTERNTHALTWDDPGVCKYQLCGPCPSKLFKNTKSDLGKWAWWCAALVSTSCTVLLSPCPLCTDGLPSTCTELSLVRGTHIV